MFSFVLNGERMQIDEAGPGATLLDFVRARGLTGSKEGCAEGECGACAMVVVTPHGTGSAYRVVNSCLLLLAAAADHEFYSVEALAANGDLVDAQRVMAAAGGSQCGYCTPGFVVSLFAEQYRPGRTGACDVAALGGNLCRCTGYRPIRDAALAVGPAPAGPWRERLAQPAPELHSLRTPGFSRPDSVSACIDLLAQDPSATLLSGGTDIGVESNLKARRWSHLVSVEGIEELRTFTEDAEAVRIGAALPLADIAAAWSQAPDAVRNWFTLFASPLIRNRATLGGNLATASPIGDAAPLLLALDASLELAGPGGRRTERLADFFTGYRKTTMRQGEIITTVVVPKPWPQRLAFFKVAKRRLDDISTVAAALGVDTDADGRIVRARVAFGGVAATPVRLEAVEQALVGHPWTQDAVARAQDAVARTITPIGDHRGSREYRLAIAQSLLAKFFAESDA